jgi:protein-disulfide isomerase
MTALLRRVSTSVLAGLVLATVSAVVGWHAVAAQVPAASPQTPSDVTAEFLRQYQASPRLTVPVMSSGASVVIVKFTDYQCPACGASHRLYKPVLEKYEAQFPGAVKMIVKNYPLDKSCNSSLVQTIHPAGCAAAVAVTLARAEKQDVPMEDWLYSNQQLLTPDTVRKAAELVGNVRDFSGGYARAIEQVKADVGLGRLLDVNSTPTFFINGVKIAQVLQPELFDAAIAFELRRAGKLK